MFDLALAAAEAKPAGGAELTQVALATGGATAATAALLALGAAHRAGRTDRLQRAAESVSRWTGLPAWAALPVQLASLSLLVALFGMYWDISLHIDNGRDEGPLANPAHYFILLGLYGIFAAGLLACVLPQERPSRAAVRVTRDWHVPVGGIVLLGCASFSLIGFPLDDVWHRLFGQDVTLWGPTHLMLIGGAGLALIGNAILMVEGRGRREAPAADAGSARAAASRVADWMHGMRHAGMCGGLLIGLSTFQAEFDFGVPQFRFVFQPLLIAFAAGAALVVARLYGGRGAALLAVAYFLVIRGVVALVVGPVLGQTTPHMPIYLASALVVEAVALWLGTQRPYRFAVVAGLGVGTIGTAAEWAWSHVWMPLPWPSSLLPEAAVAAPLAGLAGALMGAFAGQALRAARSREERFRFAPALAPAALGLVLVMAVIGWGLADRPDAGVRAQVAVDDGRVTARIVPASAARDADWVTVTSWQGGGLVVDRMQRVGDGVFRTTGPVPLSGDWKTILRLHRDRSITGVPLWLPEDPAIPAPEVPAPPRFERAFVADHEILQREQKDGVAGWLTTAAYLLVLAIALGFVALIGWALRRLARSVAETPPPAAGRTGRFARRRTPASEAVPA
jgi:hypothetical protein